MNRNFEKTPKKALRPAAEMDTIRAKKGKLHKPTRGKDNWSRVDMYTTTDGCQKVHETAIRMSHQAPAWELL